MPVLTVYVDEEPVSLQLQENDDLSLVASELEARNYNVYPHILADGKEVRNVCARVDFKTTYKFGKQCASTFS